MIGRVVCDGPDCTVEVTIPDEEDAFDQWTMILPGVDGDAPAMYLCSPRCHARWAERMVSAARSVGLLPREVR